MQDLSFLILRPYWLLALAPLALFGGWLIRRKDRLGDWDRAVSPALLQALTAMGQVQGVTRRWTLWAVFSSAILVVLALAGPAVERRDTPAFRNLDAAIFVLDVSKSMTESPQWTAMQTLGLHVLSSLGSRPGALVLYAGDAYVAEALTHDVIQVGQTLSLIQSGILPEPGSRPERGLQLAFDILDQTHSLSGDVILLSDGAGLAEGSLALAAALKARGARLSLVSITAPAPTQLAHAEVGGGRMFPMDSPEALARFLRDNTRASFARQAYPLLYWRDLGRSFLLIAALLLLPMFRRRPA
ncbi:MAG: hypothetical protein BM562_12000 [Alphaproteobacteria bacterium MedPE-SWcel]|nr:MAG: hypothetical protein BM562_12000 [Alphaproteobacteria bacterium MedPE-SWcel]